MFGRSRCISQVTSEYPRSPQGDLGILGEIKVRSRCVGGDQGVLREIKVCWGRSRCVREIKVC